MVSAETHLWMAVAESDPRVLTSARLLDMTSKILERVFEQRHDGTKISAEAKVQQESSPSEPAPMIPPPFFLRIRPGDHELFDYLFDSIPLAW